MLLSPERGRTSEPSTIGDTQYALRAAQEWLLSQQHPDGHWVGELEGDTILESEYVLMLQFLGDPDRSKMQKLCRYMVQTWQNEDGGFPIYRGGPSEVSASVKVYFACKLAGHTADEPFMQRLRECVLRLGGVTRCNTFTKLYLSIFGQYDWDGVPTIPPEMFFVPNWFYLNLYEMSSWSRAILVPLAVINAARPHREVPPGAGIDELYAVPRTRRNLRLPWDRGQITWKNVFLAVDRLLKIYDKFPVKPFRTTALRRSEAWLRERQDRSGGLGAIFPAMTHAVMAYICLGYPQDHPAVQHELRELARFEIEDENGIRMQPCLSPVWDTAISLNALLDSGVPRTDPRIQKAVEWLLSKQTTTRADWAVKTPNVVPGGWYFEYENEFYPDVDDTVMVLMALYKAACEPGADWRTAEPRIRAAMQRGLDWVLAMQNRDGGWASFDKDNTRFLFECVPFADHNAMLDPATSDITARTLEALSFFGYGKQHPSVRAALDFLEKDQCEDGSWFGRWGVNYIYGTWQTLRGLARIGIPADSPRVRRAVEWLKRVQNADGGWGETCESYDDISVKGIGPSTASQTAWAVMGLVNAGESDSPAVQRGLQFLQSTQRPDGTWDEQWFTGTGFPKVFYLRYHLYRHYFPLWAMAQYLQRQAELDA